MDPERIKLFIDAMAASDLTSLEFSEGGWTLRLTRGAAAPMAAPTLSAPDRRAASRPVRAKSIPNGEVRAPMSGIVYLRPAPDKPDFVSRGYMIAPGAIICMVEAMKMFHEVRAERGGAIDAILVASGDEVEAGQPIVRMG